MDFQSWLTQNWFALLQTLGIVGSLLATIIMLRLEIRSRRVTNLLQITTNHREIWSELYSRPELARVLDKHADVNRVPISDAEDLFVTLLILHLNSAFHGYKSGVVLGPDGMQKDICRFFSLPIPTAIWQRLRDTQDSDFVRFVETHRTLRYSHRGGFYSPDKVHAVTFML